MWSQNLQRSYSSYRLGGFMKLGFIGLLTIVFIVLKLVNVIQWSWLWVLSPLWIAAIIWVLLVILCAIVSD